MSRRWMDELAPSRSTLPAKTAQHALSPKGPAAGPVEHQMKFTKVVAPAFGVLLLAVACSSSSSSGGGSSSSSGSSHCDATVVCTDGCNIPALCP